MAALHSRQRGLLERTVIAARETAERAAEVALRTLAVEQAQAFPRLAEEERTLRVRLRAEARRLGDGLEKNPEKPFPVLVTELAYAQWHRMLFARFLAENGLLMHPDGVPVALEECAELAAMEGEADGWVLAARYAAGMLPGIFRPDDPVMQVRLAAEGRLALERLVRELPAEVFTADDGLGWVYQFWQTRRKKEVNESGAKVSGADIAAVTQLFTEDYMVRFLLQNSLGAWWAARHADDPILGEMEYLRFKEDGTPAAGSFPGWPERAAELKILDPCCGSGHFLVAAFDMMRRFRMREEGLGEAEAGDAVLRDNLFGLELDPRCTQIAAFALALAAWKAGGYRPLPLPNIACSGLPVGDRLHEWTHLADGDPEVEATLRRLFYLFRDAPDLGSLIDPARVTAEEGLFALDWEQVGPLLERALAKERDQVGPAAAVFGASARSAARAAALMAGDYHLVATNVPYLGRSKQGEILRKFLLQYHKSAQPDLATAFIERCVAFCSACGASALVTPKSWLFSVRYRAMREQSLKAKAWNLLAPLGTGAFETISGEVVNVCLMILTNAAPCSEQVIGGVDVSASRTPNNKAVGLRSSPVLSADQAGQLRNPSAVVSLSNISGTALLRDYALCSSGMLTGDRNRFYRSFWEPAPLAPDWEFSQSSVNETIAYGGRSQVIFWQRGKGELYQVAQSLKHLNNAVQNWQRGQEVWSRVGVAISIIGKLPCSVYNGNIFDNNLAVMCPRDPAIAPAIWAFCSSPDFQLYVRRLNQKLSVDPGYLAAVPFDLERWQKVADEMGPLPEPHSDDPTQWLFHGHPARSTEPLQVAVARLLGYRWPQNEAGAAVPGAAVPGAVPGAEPPGYTDQTPLKRAGGGEGSASEPHSWGFPLCSHGVQPVDPPEIQPSGYTGQTPLKRAGETDERPPEPPSGGFPLCSHGVQGVSKNSSH